MNNFRTNMLTLVLMFATYFAIGQGISVDWESNGGEANIEMINTDGVDEYARVWFRNTIIPNDIWSIRAGTKDASTSDMEFRYFTGGSTIELLNLNGKDKVVSTTSDVGIGTSEPTEALHIENGEIFVNNTSTSAKITIDTDDTTDDASLTVRSGTDAWSVGSEGTENLFKISPGGLGSVDHFTMNTSGDIGIKTSPNANAEVTISGAGSPAHLRIQENNNSGNAVLSFANVGVDDDWRVMANAIQSGFNDPRMNFNWFDDSASTDNWVMNLNGLHKRVIVNPGGEDIDPDYTMTVRHNAGSPVNLLDNTRNGLSIKVAGASQNQWIMYTSSSQDRLRFYYKTTDAANPSLAAHLTSAGSLVAGSDKKLKNNIKTMTSAVTGLMNLRPTTYKLNADETNKTQFGLIAQEVKEIYPEVVYEIENMEEDGRETLGVAYNELIPVIISGMQEQQNKIESLEAQLKLALDRLDAIEK